MRRFRRRKLTLYGDDFHDPATDLIALTPDEERDLQGNVPLLKRGGLIAFSQLNVHRGRPNHSERIRWSVDVRFEASEGATPFGQRFGFTARSPSGRFHEHTYDEWRERCVAALPGV